MTPEFMRGFTESLEEVEQAGNGWGRLVSAVVEAEEGGEVLTATFKDNRWDIAVALKARRKS